MSNNLDKLIQLYVENVDFRQLFQSDYKMAIANAGISLNETEWLALSDLNFDLLPTPKAGC